MKIALYNLAIKFAFSWLAVTEHGSLLKIRFLLSYTLILFLCMWSCFHAFTLVLRACSHTIGQRIYISYKQ